MSFKHIDEQMTLGELIETLESLKPDSSIYYDFEYLQPTNSVHSYRGYYEDLSLDYTEEGPEITVAQLLKVLKEAVGKDFTGYKGGEFTMRSSTILWVSHHNHSGGTAIVGVDDMGYQVIIRTKKVE